MVQGFAGGSSTAPGHFAQKTGSAEDASARNTGVRDVYANGSSSSSEVGGSSIGTQIGADFSRHPKQYKQIIEKAERDGLQIDILSFESGMLQFTKGRQILMRLSLGAGMLEPGNWENKVGTVIAQIQFGALVQRYRQELLQAPEVSYDAAPTLTHRNLISDVSAILDTDPTRISLRMNQFPGAEQIQVFFEDRQIASLIQNPVLNIVLEFRLNLAVLDDSDDALAEQPLTELFPEQILTLEHTFHDEFQVLGIPAERIADLRSEIAHLAVDLESALLELASLSNLRVLAVGDTHYGFGDPNRRLGTSMLRRLCKSGFTHFAIPAPKREAERIQSSLQNGTFRRVWLEIASKSATSKLSVEWTALIQRAFDVGMQVVAVGCAGPDPSSSIAAGVLDTLLADEQAKVLLWLDNAELARSASGPHCSVGELLQRSLGKERISTVLAVTGQVPGATLKFLTEGPEREHRLKRAILIPMQSARKVASIPWSLNSPTKHGAWDYVALYPGTIESSPVA